MEQNKITPSQALQNLYSGAQEARLNAREHKAVEASVVVLANFIKDNSEEHKPAAEKGEK